MTGEAYVKARTMALALAPGQRAELARDLLASLDGPADPDVDALWEAEIIRRIRRVDEGREELLTPEEVFARIRRRCDDE